MNTVEFLDAVKRQHGLTSDYQLAKKLGWSTQRLSGYRIGRRELDDEACVQVAELLGVQPAYVMACIAGARAKSAAIKKHWAAAARLLKTGTAAVMLVTAGLLAQNAPASPTRLEARLTGQAIHYAPFGDRPPRRPRWSPPRRNLRRPVRRRRRNLRTVIPRTPIVA